MGLCIFSKNTCTYMNTIFKKFKFSLVLYLLNPIKILKKDMLVNKGRVDYTWQGSEHSTNNENGSKSLVWLKKNHTNFGKISISTNKICYISLCIFGKTI